MTMKTTRRGFLGSAVGALGVGLLPGCSDRLPRYLVPYAIPPDDVVPGIAQHYRTICRECPAACGVTARVREGRAVKLEGSPDHPVSRGALCPRGQAAIEGLYSPDRLGMPRSPAGDISWEQAEHALVDGVRRALDARKLVVVVTRPEPGSVGALFRAWLAALGQEPSQVVTFDPMEPAWLREGARRAFGTEATPVPDLAAASLLVSIGDDFVEDGSPVERARALADMRAAGGRFVYVGPRLSLTAAAADEWLSPAPGSEPLLVLGLARRVLERAAPDASVPDALRARLAAYDPAKVAAATGIAAATLDRLAQAMVRDRSLCLGPGRAVAGADAAALAEAVFVLNAVAGNVGRTLRFLPRAPAPWAGPSLELADLLRRAAAGEVGALLVHHANPRGFATAFGPVAAAFDGVPFVAAFANQLDETAARAHLVLPDHHFLETWSDASPRPGVTGIQQPVMSPVLPTRAAADELLAVARALGKTTGLPDGPFEVAVRGAFDEKDIERGGRFAEVAPEPVTVAEGALAGGVAGLRLRGPDDGLPLVVAPTLRHRDGLPPRGALLKELPDPLTTISWSGWVEVGPATARGLGVTTGDVVALEGAGGRTELPAHITPGVREGLVAVPVEHANALLDGGGPALGFVTRVRARPTGVRARPPHAAGSQSQHGRNLARKVDPSERKRLPMAPLPSLYPPVQHPVHRWGLGIDLDRCTGCGACVAACYVENNLPVVGAEEVARGRDMAWLSVQSFVDASGGVPEVSFLPLMCQHCTNAPCESVCPTYATYHTQEGLNAQVYARCVGTRYCENNCPYGVRRFNFFDWPRKPPTNLGLNPDVTVRERGVTEKCTMCIHRIRGGEEQAKVEGRAPRDGEIVTACAATCPARAIVFGDLADPASEISRWAADGRAYHLLEELNTRPGNVYLARRKKDGT